MSEYPIRTDEEFNVVRTAYFLEDRIRSLRVDKSHICNRKPSLPEEPIKPKAVFERAKVIPYPEIHSTLDVESEIPLPNLIDYLQTGLYIFIACIVGFVCYRVLANSVFSVIMILISHLIGAVSMIGVYVAIFFALKGLLEWHKDKKQIQTNQKIALDADIERIRSSEAYQLQCRKIDEENRNNQEYLDRKHEEDYNRAMEEYRMAYLKYTEALDFYRTKELPAWNAEIAEIDDTIAETENTLRKVYDTNIIPLGYRNISALSYLAAFLSTSHYDLKFAIERYDKEADHIKQDRLITMAEAQLEVSRSILNNQQYSVWLTEQLAEMSAYGNDMLKSIDVWQKADILFRTYHQHKIDKENKKNHK